MPELLICSPKDTEFVGIKEYLASAPAKYALEDSPVLYLTTDGNLSGMMTGPARMWVASNGLHFWPTSPLSAGQSALRGFTVRLDEINLHAIQTEPPSLYLQIQGERDYDFSELRFAPQAPVSKVYEAVSVCIESFAPLNGEYGEQTAIVGSEIDNAAPLHDLASGQGDDEVYFSYNDSASAAADVEVEGEGRLGKSRRRSDSLESDRTRKQPR